jgi:hypothetical protein
MSKHDNYDNDLQGDGQMHSLALGDLCNVNKGKFAGKRVLVIKPGIQTKYGLKTITVEYYGEHKTGEKIWVAPDQLVYEGVQDLDTAGAIKEADYQDWKARQAAGVPPSSALKKKTYFKKKEDDQDDEIPF